MARRRNLRTRMAISHLTVVATGLVAALGVAVVVSPSFLRGHLMNMSMTMMDMTTTAGSELEEAFRVASAQVLTVAAALSVVVALIAAYFASGRLLRPIDAVRTAARRMADGRYTERLPLPEDEELAALAIDINRLAETLEQTEARRVRLLNDVSHELRTPLSTIEGYMEAILDGVLDPTPDIMASVAAESRRLKRLAADISVLSRAEEGVLPLEHEDLDLAALVAEVTQRLRPQLEANGVSLDVTENHGLVVSGDGDRLVQVVTNLVGNALAHTPEGGSVTLRCSQEGADAVIEVIDTGSGIQPAQLEKIFERFYRADQAAPGGTGVGLTIARGIARMHGGDLTAHSEGPGTGATFRLTLPLA